MQVVKPGPDRETPRGVVGGSEISQATTGAHDIYMGRFRVPAGARSRPHYHEGCESALYMLSGRIAIHELGHSVGGLADEYFTEGTTYPGGEPREPNVTTDPRGTKWASDLGRNTPDGGVIGAYQGGRYYERGIYRPSQDSLMRNINKPFNLIGLVAMERAISSKIR